MEKKCFTCGESFQNDETAILKRYKEISERTGVQYWFFKVKGENNVQIATADDFKNFKKNNEKLFKAKKVEFANIREFGNPSNSEILGNNKDGQSTST